MRVTTCTALFALTLATMSCDVSNEPSFAAYVCMAGSDDRGALKDILRQTASRHRLQFGDLSAETEIELRILAVPGIERSSPLINFRVWGADGLSIQADNMGLPAEQVAIRFTQGRAAQKSDHIHRRLIDQLRARWPMHVASAARRKSFNVATGCDHGRDA